MLDPKHAAEESGAQAKMHGEVNPAEGPAARHRLDAEADLRAAVDGLGDDVDSVIDILVNDPVDGLLAAARHVDLLVIGSRGHGHLRAAILGSVSHSVSQHAPCPVIILPRG